MKKLLLCLLLGTNGLWAQDIHLSQYIWQMPLINPAQTGLIPDGYRAAATVRRQWQQVPVPYSTAILAYDQPWQPRFAKGFRLGVGGSLLADRSGDSRLQWTNVGIQASAMRVLGPRLSLSIGFQLQYQQRRFKDNNLSFDSQYNGFQYDPTLDTKENFIEFNSHFLNAATGANLMLQIPHSRTRGNVGLAVHNLLTPSYRYTNTQAASLAIRTTLHTDFYFQLNNTLDWHFAFMTQEQGNYYELLGSTGVRAYLRNSLGNVLWLQPEITYRLRDAFSPSVAVGYNRWVASLGYDINTSAFKIATEGRGGPELTLIYQFTKIIPIKDCGCKAF